jgi:hypothetical protein
MGSSNFFRLKRCHDETFWLYNTLVMYRMSNIR